METEFVSQYCRAKIQTVNHDIIVQGVINDHVKERKIRYIAAAPADYKNTFSGSGFPFVSQLQAFDSTPNFGDIGLTFQNEFKIKLILPNSYAVGLGSIIVPPTLFIMYYNENNQEKLISIKLSDGIPYRHITYPIERKGPEFYNTQFYLYPMDQWKQLEKSGYPKINKQYKSYFSQRPPH
jgi:hypothetical protein